MYEVSCIKLSRLMFEILTKKQFTKFRKKKNNNIIKLYFKNVLFIVPLK